MPAAKGQILFVDDDADIRFMLTTFLGLSGYVVTAAGTLADGLSLAQSGRFDLYLLDNLLADGTGLELCQRLREFDPRTPILFYSGDAEGSARQQALSVGAQEYLMKPDDLEGLEQTIAKLLGDRRPGEQDQQLKAAR